MREKHNIYKIQNNGLILWGEKNNFYYIYSCIFMCSESIQIVPIKP